MSNLDTLPQPGTDAGEQFKGGRNEYAGLKGGEATAEQVQPAGPDRQALNDRAADIVGAIAYATQKRTNAMTYREAYGEAHEAYVTDEADPALKKFGRMVLLAPMAARANTQLDVLDQKSQLTPEESAERVKLTKLKCEYNNLLGEVVEDQLKNASDEASEVTPDDVQGWLEKSTGGNLDYAKRTVKGMQAELAAMPLLEEAGVHELARGGVEADLKGKDIVFARTARGYDGVDVKSGSQRPKMPVTRDDHTGNLLLSINPSHLNNFRVKDDFVDGYVEELQTQLH